MTIRTSPYVISGSDSKHDDVERSQRCLQTSLSPFDQHRGLQALCEPYTFAISGKLSRNIRMEHQRYRSLFIGHMAVLWYNPQHPTDMCSARLVQNVATSDVVSGARLNYAENILAPGLAMKPDSIAITAIGEPCSSRPLQVSDCLGLQYRRKINGCTYEYNMYTG